jgi:hypothetical protein
VIDAASAGELRIPTGQAPPAARGNHRNRSTPKTVATDLGPVAVHTPRDRGTFEPKLVGKRQTSLANLDEKIVFLYAGRHERQGHLRAPLIAAVACAGGERRREQASSTLIQLGALTVLACQALMRRDLSSGSNGP